MARLIAAILLALTLASCGFQPRGETSLALPLQTLYLESSDPYGELAMNLKQYLKASHVKIVAAPKEASTVLEIISEQTGQQLLSVGGTQQTRQYNLTLTVQFQITHPNGAVLVPPQTVAEARTIPILANQTLAGSNEATNLYRKMRQAIVYDIMNRISSKDVTMLVTKKL